MKTAIIDRSLSGLKFLPGIKKSDILMYVAALQETGVDYIEIDLEALGRIQKPNGSENYIFRINHQEELQLVNALPFKYAVLPLKLSYLIPKINIPILLELNLGDVDLLTYIKVISEHIDFTKISLLRLTGDFNDKRNIPEIIHRLSLHFPLPIDICPNNNSMMALSSAVTALFSKAGAITLSFGDSDNYASLEEFIIALATNYKIIISGSYIKGICKAAILAPLIGNIKTDNMQAIIKTYQHTSKKINKIDEFSETNYIDSINYNKVKHKSVTEKTLENFELDKNIYIKLKNILENSTFTTQISPNRPDFLN